MPEVRIDPLTGLRTIVAADRAARPGGGLSATAPDPIDTEKDPFLEGHEDRTPPEIYALRADGSAPDTPGLARARRAQPLPGARPRAARRRSPSPSPTCSPSRRPRGAHEVVINAPDPVTSLAQLEVGQVATRSTCGASGCARTPRTARPTCT